MTHAPLAWTVAMTVAVAAWALVGGAGCASSDAGAGAKATAAPGTNSPASARGGHWVMLPPPTGSNIPQRIWVEDSGPTTATNADVRTVSPEALDRVLRRPSNAPRSGN